MYHPVSFLKQCKLVVAVSMKALCNIAVIFGFTLLLIECATQEQNVCEKGDIKCHRSNLISTPGKLRGGKCHKGFVIIRKQGTSLLECITECFLTSHCEAINYRKIWNLCELVTNATSDNLLEEKGCASSNISTWPKSLAGNCVDHNCSAGKKCQWSNGLQECVHAYCKDKPPTISYASFSEKFGVSRDIGAAFKLKCDDGYYMAGNSFLICSNVGIWVNRPPNCCIRKETSLMNRNRPRHCNVIPKYCNHGVYKISPTPETTFNVYCHVSQSDNASNLLLIQRRWSNSTSFERNWTDYENGFGDVYSAFWLGNKNIHLITSTRDYGVRFDLTPYIGETKNVSYKHFKVGNSESNYKLEISGYLDSDTDSSMSIHNGMPFSTFDSDHDVHPTNNCADKYHGGWWYRRCHSVNLNGIFGDFNQSVNSSFNAQGIQWYSMTKHTYSLKQTQIWIRTETLYK